jgi:TonB family protein
LFTVIQKMMAKKPEDRYQTADEAVLALEMIGGAQGRGSMADMATMPTLAIEPMKRPAASATDKTTPLPRASGSMAKPAEAAAPTAPAAGKAGPAKPTSAKPAAPPAAVPAKPKPSFRPAPKPRSKAPYVALGVIALVAAALGGYMLLGRGPGTQVALQTPPDTAPRTGPLDTAKAQAPADTGTHPAVTTPAATDTARHAAPQTTPPHTTPTQPPRTVTTPPRSTTTPTTTPTTHPAPAPGTTAGRTGTLIVSGMPNGARITVDGQAGGFLRQVPPGSHQLHVEATGYQPYDARISIVAGQTRNQRVSMVAGTAAAPAATPGAQATPGAATPQAAVGAQPAECVTSRRIGQVNRNGMCYTTPPVSRTLLLVAPPAACPATTRAADLMLKVNASGGVDNASVVVGSNCPGFNEAAVAFANDLQFSPATKNGTPVVAWIRRLFRPAPRRP